VTAAALAAGAAAEDCPPLNSMVLQDGLFFYSDPAFSNFSMARTICEEMLGLKLAPMTTTDEAEAVRQLYYYVHSNIFKFNFGDLSM